MNVQDNLLKSSDGFFTTTQAKADAIAEMSLTTASVGAESLLPLQPFADALQGD